MYLNTNIKYARRFDKLFYIYSEPSSNNTQIAYVLENLVHVNFNYTIISLELITKLPYFIQTKIF